MRALKTAEELRAIVVAALRKDPSLVGVADVAIIRPTGGVVGWDAAFLRNGEMITPPGAFQVVAILQSQYDLAHE